MRHLYRDDPAHCYAPLLGNGDLLFPMDAEGGICESLPTPPGLPSAALYRLASPASADPLFSYGSLIPTIAYLGEVLRPISVSTEFSTDEAILFTVCRYPYHITVETRACAVAGKPMLMIEKKVSAPGDVLLSYTLKTPEGSPMRFSVQKDMLIGERPLRAGQEKLCLFSTAPMYAEAREDGGLLYGMLSKNESATVYLFFADSESRVGDECRSRIAKMKSYIYKTGENRLFRAHVSAWREYWEENEFHPGDPLLSRVADGSAYLLACYARRGGSPLCAAHPYAPLGRAPSVDLRVISALLHGGHTAAARAILDSLYRLLPIAEARVGGVGACFPYYTDGGGWERLPADGQPGRIVQTADVAVAFYRYYRFTEDRHFLREVGFPVVKSAASYLLEEAVRTDGRGAHVLAADPLLGGERRVRPLLSSVAVASALSSYAALAEVLGVDREAAASARATAGEILATLPVKGGVYVAAEGEDEPGAAPLYLPFYDVTLAEECLRRTTLQAAAHSVCLGTPYGLSLLGTAYAAIHTSALGPLTRAAAAADDFGFLPTAGAEGIVETAAVFLEGLYLSLASCRRAPDGQNAVYVAFGLDQDAPTDGEFILSLPIGGRVDGRIQGGRFVSLRLLREPGSSLRTATVVMPLWLYTDGAAVAVRKTERGGMLYLSTVAHKEKL